MSVRNTSMKEQKWKDGKLFSFLHFQPLLLAGATEYVVVNVADRAMVVDFIQLESDSEVMEWQAFAGTQYTDETGLSLDAISRNILAATKSSISIEVNPTIQNNGQPLFASPISLVGQQAAGNRTYIKEPLLSGLYTLLPNTAYMFTVKNTSTNTCKCDVNFSFFDYD